MRRELRRWAIVAAIMGLALPGWEGRACAQAQPSDRGDRAGEAGRAGGEDVKALTELVRQLQAQVQSLNARVNALETSEKSAVAEAQNLRAELGEMKAGSAVAGRREERVDGKKGSSGSMESELQASADVTSGSANGQSTSVDERIARLEEDLQLANSKIQEQSQTKLESSSKYRVRLSGLALFNLFGDSGSEDNEDVPQFARPTPALNSPNAFGGSVRQTQIGLEGFGPEIGGARTSAEVRFDFAGGFTPAPNGYTMGIMRLRTGTMRFDWENTSIVAGQDYLFFSPLTPTSYASLAIPALSYSGNLWGWTPQVRVEQKYHVSEASTILVQGGILEALSGDYPAPSYERMPTHGEQSGEPAYGARVAWSHPGRVEDIVAGIGGYYGRQSWGFGRNVDGWAGTADLSVPLGQYLEFSGQFYRGRAVGGLGGGIGQSVLWNGVLTDPATEVYGLNSIGGWAQLKVKPTSKFEINGAVGEDSPFASELRQFKGNPLYSSGLLSKNLTPFVNFIYHPRSDVVFSLEYKHLKTYTLDSNANSASHINLSVGYIF